MDERTFLLITGIIGGFFIGGFCGAVPLVVAIVKKKLIWGIASIVLCITCGIIFAIVLNKPAFLSLPIAAVCTVIILLVSSRKKQKPDA